MRGFTEQDRPYPQPRQIVLRDVLYILQNDAVKYFGVSAPVLHRLSSQHLINRIIAEKDNRRYVFYYFKELKEVLMNVKRQKKT